MSMSTTSTATYILNKYSRAYPMQANGSQNSDSEWQHFTNPVIRLFLDMKNSANGELESYRVRILWSIDSGIGGAEIQQSDVIFEDIELLSFSSIPSQSFSAHGLPLKAVYREAVVGIRYMHPKTPCASPNYRRFQMNFQSQSDASSFIEAIRHVCPCKANPPAQPSLVRASTMVNNQSSRPTASASTNMPPPPLPVSAVALSKASLRPAATIAIAQCRPSDNSPSSSQRMAISTLVTAEPSELGGTANTGASMAQNSFNDLHLGATLSTDPISTPATTTVNSLASETRAPNHAPAASPCGTHIRSSTALESESASSLPLATTLVEANPMSMPSPEAVGPQLSSQPMPMDINTTVPILPKVTSIYDLGNTELEALVGEVIREDDFVKLLENLDSMWRVKILLGK